MDWQRTPLIEAIKHYKRRNPVSFHVPGHKNGLFFHEDMYEDFKGALPYDVTELTGLDDLHAPSGPILEAQGKAAELYRAKRTFFLVGGTTVGNLAMIYGCFERGDQVLVQRNSHKSIFHAMEIAGVTPILLAPEYDPVTTLPIGVSIETFEDAITRFPEAKGLILTYPNYYGISLDLKSLIMAAKQRNMLVLVDEAHAAHYCLGDPFPYSTLDIGADVVVQSAHKMLPALTMSSFLHISEKLNGDVEHRIKEALAMFQSSSPSYLLMASLDGARSYAESLTKAEIDIILAGIDVVKKELSKIKQIEVVNWNVWYLSDPLKVTIRTTTKLTGFELQDIFIKNNLYPELADDKHVLFIFGLGEVDLERSIQAIHSVSKLLQAYDVVNDTERESPRVNIGVKKFELSSLAIRKAKKRRVLLNESVGLISAESIIPYPPGVPLVLPGERIDKHIIEEIEKLIAVGAKFQLEHELKDVLVIDSEDDNE